MVSFCSDGSYPVRPSRRTLWQPTCPFSASGDHFRPCQGPSPTGAVAVSSGRPAAAAGVMPRARGLAFLSRRPIWRLAHKKMLRTGRGPVRSKTFIAHKITFFNLQAVRLDPTSAPCQSESSTAVLGALHMKLSREFIVSQPPKQATFLLMISIN